MTPTPKAVSNAELLDAAIEYFSQTDSVATWCFTDTRRQEIADGLLRIKARLTAPSPAPYGYLWFDQDMERRFTYDFPHPLEHRISEVMPVYADVPPWKNEMVWKMAVRATCERAIQIGEKEIVSYVSNLDGGTWSRAWRASCLRYMTAISALKGEI